jgi:ADP-ribosylarginine hydrolase
MVGRNVEQYNADKNKDYFINAWKSYTKDRQLNDLNSEPVFPNPYGIKERDAYYTSIAWKQNWGGASGHDSVIIAYDAFLNCDGDWIKFIDYGALHGGDSDSTAAIGAAWFGAYYFDNEKSMATIPKNHWEEIEFKDDLLKYADDLYTKSQTCE